MTKTVSHQGEKTSIKRPKREDLFSQKKKLEFLAEYFDPSEFPPKDSLMQELMKEFHLIGDNPFTITNQILVLLDQTLEEIKELPNS